MKKLIKFLSVIIGFFILMTIFMFVFQICPPPGPWPMPPWCDDGFAVNIPGMGGSGSQTSGSVVDLFNNPVFLTNVSQMDIPMISADRLGSIHANVLGWQGLAIENTMYKMGSRQLIGTAHKIEMPVISSMNLRFLIRANPIEYKETAIMDLYGNPIPLGDLPQFMHGTYWRNLLNPQYIEMLLDDAKANIDLGVSGIVFDDDGDGMVSGIIYGYGGSFDEYTMSGFREYLEGKYTKEELKTKFAIDNIEKFHFGEYIIKHKLEDSWNKDSQFPHPLTYEFSLFKSQAIREVVKDVIQTLKDYALEKYNRELLISFNISPVFAEKLYGGGYDMADVLYGEHFWFHKYHFKGAVAAKLVEGLTSRQFSLLFEVNHDRGRLATPIGNLFKYAFADVYSTGNTGLQIAYPGSWTMDYWGYVDPLPYDDTVFEQYVGFMQDNKHLFGLKEPANVAVVHSLASRRLDFLPIESKLHNGGAPDRQIISVVDMLLNLNVPFHMLISGDGMLGVNNTIDEAVLKEYNLVILPNVMVLSDAEIDAVIQYVKNGGKVIQINDFATLTSQGQRVNRQDLAGFTQDTGKHTLGQGVWLKENWGNFEFACLYGEGTHLLPTEQTKDNQHFQRLKRLLNENISLDINVDSSLTVSVRRFVDNDRLVLHIVNYDYDQTIDQFNPSGAIEISLEKEGLSIKSAMIYDLESGGVFEIPIEEKDEKIIIRIPNIDVYSIIELR